jgi:hypothetical protein
MGTHECPRWEGHPFKVPLPVTDEDGAPFAFWPSRHGVVVVDALQVCDVSIEVQQAEQGARDAVRPVHLQQLDEEG